jgi:hypothetical protein
MRHTQNDVTNDCGGTSIGCQTEGIVNSPATSGKEVRRMNHSMQNHKSCLVEHRPWSQKVGGFTITELLVVIAIITLLMGILIPVLNEIRRKPGAVNCRSNLRGVGIGLQMYAGDNGGRYCAVANPSETVQEVQKLLLPYVKDKKIFYCPVSKDPIDFCVTYDPKTTLSNVRLDLLSRPDHILLAGESTTGTHKDNMLNVITGAFEVVEITEQEWFQRITRSSGLLTDSHTQEISESVQL